MSEKMWGGEPFWGLGYEWDPGLGPDRPPEGAARDADRALREGDAREREALRRRAAVPAPQPRAARRARLPRAHRARGVRRPRREPRRLRDDVRDDRALRLRLDRDVLRHAHRRGQRDHAAPHARADRQVHPAAQLGQDRDALLLRPRDRLALLVPDLLGRRARRTAASRCARRRRGRRRPASPTSTSCRRRARTSRATTTSRCSSSTATTSQSQPSLWDALGLRGNQSGPLEVPNVEIPGDQLVGPVGDGAALERRVGRPVVPASARRRCGTASRSARSTSRSATRRASATSTSACASPTTRRSRTTSARRSWTRTRARLFVLSVAQAMDRATDDNTKVLAAGRARPRRLPALGLADQVRGREERRARRRQDAPRVRWLRLQARHGARALPARRARPGWVMGPTNEVLRQFVGKAVAPRLRRARLLEPVVQPPGGRERGEEARRGRQARARGEAAWREAAEMEAKAPASA